MPRKYTQAQWRKKCVEQAKKRVRERDKMCQRCGRSDGALHVSHVLPEGKYHGLSDDLQNLKLLCYQCHFHWWHSNPIEAGEWFKTMFPDRWKYLKKLKNVTIKKDWEKEYQRWIACE